jgi:hypothetical protein
MTLQDEQDRSFSGGASSGGHLATERALNQRGAPLTCNRVYKEDGVCRAR